MSIIPFGRRRSRHPEPAEERGAASHAGLPDIELMLRVADGDESAFEELMPRYWTALVSYTSRLLDDLDAGRDAAQETFIRLWEHRRRWRPGPLKSYLFTLARSVAVDELRRRRVRDLFAAQSRSELEHQAPAVDLTDRDQLAHAIDAAIQLLPPRAREVFTLAYLRGLSYQEVAEVMQISPKTVGNHMTVALAQLRSLLEPVLPLRPK